MKKGNNSFKSGRSFYFTPRLHCTGLVGSFFGRDKSDQNRLFSSIFFASSFVGDGPPMLFPYIIVYTV